MTKGWIGVDLDGTLAHYEGWVHHTEIGKPIQPMIERVKAWLAEGKDVRIFTARVQVWPEIGFGPAQSREAHVAITEWCILHLGQALPITNVKDQQMIELWDDRAVQVEANTGRPLGESTRGLK